LRHHRTMRHGPSEPFVWQLRRKEATRNYHHYTTGHITGLHRELRRILKVLAIPKRIIPHDLRRTTAVEFYKITHDLRAVQALLGHRNLPSTLWYLDHDATPVNRANLELIKNPNWRMEKSA